MDYIPNQPPGTYEHRLRECLGCGTVPFYRAYKGSEPLRCTKCERLEIGPEPRVASVIPLPLPAVGFDADVPLERWSVTALMERVRVLEIELGQARAVAAGYAKRLWPNGEMP